MAALKPELRKDLERVIIKARNLVVADVTDRLKELNVHEGKRGALSDKQAKLRVRLRAHGKQIGDVRNSQSDAQQIDRLVQECAYEQWHRMIFVRFLAENEFLIDPEYGQSVSMEALAEIAEESKVDPWVLGGQFASVALPAIFRKDDPLLEVRLSTESQRELNDLLGSLPTEVFTADDSLGWVYQFWQSEEKDRVNASGDKIDGRSIPAVTQLFTEHYMVLFLLHNTLGAWHAGKVLSRNPTLATNAKDEVELRRAVALENAGGYEFEYLRFVRDPSSTADSIPKGSQPLAGGREAHHRNTETVKSADPEGITAISRCSSGATPPERGETIESIPKGSQPDALSSLRDELDEGGNEPVVALRLPPASGSNAFGITDESLNASGMEEQGPWRPMGGTYEGWPKTAAELKVLDPSCGSGHFLVATFELLVRLRMHEEGLSVEAAVEAALRDNLFGLEIDPRCTQIAAFNVAMAVWKLTGPKPLPPMRNIACSGIPLGNSRDEWMKSLKVALPNSDLGFQWGQLYDMFSKADTLGSLINPQRFFGSSLITDKQLDQISESLTTAIAHDPHASDEQQELAAAAQGLTRATELLSGKYTVVITNVPYLGRGKQDDVLKEYLDTQYALGKADLATAFVLRCLEFCTKGGSTALVSPQNWLFLTTYKKLRESLLENRKWNFVARLGPGAFETIGGHVVNVALFSITAQHAEDSQVMAGIDASGEKLPTEKAARLRGDEPTAIVLIPQAEQLKNPDIAIVLDGTRTGKLLSVLATSFKGVTTGDDNRFRRTFWELNVDERWIPIQSAPQNGREWGDALEAMLFWESGVGMLSASATSYFRNTDKWGVKGIVFSMMSTLRPTLYYGGPWDTTSCLVVPKHEENLPAIWCYASSDTFQSEVRRLNQKLSVEVNHFTQVPFDLAHWQKVAAEKYPNGLPEPESDDPTQWLFHGRPEQSTAPLQVAVARLLGYRWPAELDSEMRLSQRARELVARCSELDDFVDNDGIVCIPSVRGEDPAADRLMRLLNACGSSIPKGSQPLAGGLSEANTTGNARQTTSPPQQHSIPKGSQPDMLASLRDANPLNDGDPVVALRLPPANGSNPFGVLSADGLNPCGVPPANGSNPYGVDAGEREAFAYGSQFGDLDVWLRERFFQEHCELFHQRPFIWHIWDGRKDGFSALVNYHKLTGPQGKKLLENLTYSYLGDWITRQEAAVRNNESGADDRLLAAKELQEQLEAILHGEPPYDIFVRWKPLHEQPIGWTPDINDGVRMNIRPFMLAELSRGRKGAGVLRFPPKIKWTKDRGKEPKRPPEDYPWFWGWDENTIDFAGGRKFTGERWNNLHYTIEFKQNARKRTR